MALRKQLESPRNNDNQRQSFWGKTENTSIWILSFYFAHLLVSSRESHDHIAPAALKEIHLGDSLDYYKIIYFDSQGLANSSDDAILPITEAESFQGHIQGMDKRWTSISSQITTNLSSQLLQAVNLSATIILMLGTSYPIIFCWEYHH